MVSPIRADLATPAAAPSPETRRLDTRFSQALSQSTRASGAAPPTQVVAARRTALSGEQAAHALGHAYTQLTGERPSAATTAILTAQWAHETGRGASMYNYNFGGIKGTGPSGLSVAQKTREGWGADERQIVDRFRAYNSATEGATDYVRLLQARYPKALEAARQGDAAGFVHALKARGYFTGNEQAYVRSVEFMSQQALTHGYAVLGAGAAPSAPASVSEPRLSDAAAAPLDAVQHEADALALAEQATPSDNVTPFVNALRIADEISRAALRIASDETRRRDT
ncbi:MAG TPA: glucosaminidase domain-containing protein [Polyangiaceae bacterium]